MVLQSYVKNVQTVVAYVRVSTSEQNTQRQEDVINASYHVSKWFIDKLSGKDYTLQIELQNLLNFVREGDLVVVESLSRLSRNTKDLFTLIHQFEERKIDFISLKEHITLNNTPIGKLMFHFVAAIAQFERENMKQRQREGIAIAKANGVYKGRRRIIKHPQFEQYYEKWIRKDNQYNLDHFAKDVNISGGTLSRFIKEHKILLNKEKEQKEQKKEKEDIRIIDPKIEKQDNIEQSDIIKYNIVKNIQENDLTIVTNLSEDGIIAVRQILLDLNSFIIFVRNIFDLKSIKYILPHLELNNQIKNTLLFIENFNYTSNFNEKDLNILLKTNMITLDNEQQKITIPTILFEKNINIVKELLEDFPSHIKYGILNEQLKNIDKNQLTQINFNLSLTNNGSEGKEEINELKNIVINQNIKLENLSNQLLMVLNKMTKLKRIYNFKVLRTFRKKERIKRII